MDFVHFADQRGYDQWRSYVDGTGSLAALEDLTLARPVLEEKHGVSAWFGQIDLSAETPSSHKLAVLSFLALYPMILGANSALELLPVDVSLPLSTAATVGIVAPMATYFVLPWLSRRFRSWLYGNAGPSPSQPTTGAAPQ